MINWLEARVVAEKISPKKLHDVTLMNLLGAVQQFKIQHIPIGPSLLSYLINGTNQILIHLSNGNVSGNNFKKDTDNFFTLISGISSELIKRLSGLHELKFSIEKSSIRRGEIEELCMVVSNAGAMPLQDLKIKTSPDWLEYTIDFLGEKTSSGSIFFHGQSPKIKESIFSLKLEWHAVQMNGKEINGHSVIKFDLVDPDFTEEVSLSNYGASPYVTGKELERGDLGSDKLFLGREAIMEQIANSIAEKGNVVLLEGNRRAGKSSILRHMEGPGFMQDWLCIYCSLQGGEGDEGKEGLPTREFFVELSRGIAKGICQLDQFSSGVPLPDGTRSLPAQLGLGLTKKIRTGISEGNPFSDFRDYIESVLELLSEKNTGLVLMIDEFDKLQAGIDNGITSPQVPENIRFLVQNNSRLTAILTGSKRLQRMRQEYYSALFGLGTRITVSELDRDSAALLVQNPVDQFYKFTKDAVDYLVHMSGGQPFVIQCICNQIFEEAKKMKRKTVNRKEVERSIDQWVKGNEHFASIYNTHIESYLGRLILFLCKHHCEEHELDELTSNTQFDLILIEKKLIEHGVGFKEVDVREALLELRELELVKMIENVKTKVYSLNPPAIRRWLSEEIDFQFVLSEAKMGKV